MYLKLDHARVLWNDRLVILKTQKISSLFGVACLTAICLVAMSLVNKYSIRTLLFFVAPYLFFGFTCYILLMAQKKKTSSQRNSYALTILVHQIFNQVSILLISYSLWAIGLRLVFLSLNFETRVTQFVILALKLLLLGMVAYSIINSRKFIHQKIESILAQKVITSLTPGLLRLLIITPTAGVTLGLFVFRGESQTLSLTIITVLSLLFGLFVFPIITVAFCETIILASNKWPIIKRTGSDYAIEDF